MRVHPQDRKPGVASRLRRQGGDGGAVVAAEHGKEGIGRNLGEALHRPHPAGLDVPTGLEVAYVLHVQAGEQVAFLGHWRHDRRHRADRPRRDGGAPAVHGRAVVGDPGDDDVRRRASDETAPRLEAVQVQAHSTRLRSGTCRMLSDPTTNHTTKTPNTTGKPPGRPRIWPCRLKMSSSGPPSASAMIPAPAVAMFENPM